MAALQRKRGPAYLARVRPLLILLFFLCSSCAHRSAFVDLDAAIEKELAKGIPSIAVAVARDGRIVHEAAFGLADEGVLATVHTPYPLASVTKPLVATGVMVLVEYATPEGLRHLYPFAVTMRRR